MHSAESRETTRQVDRLCIEQRRRWLAGEGIPLAALLREHPELERNRETLFQLVYSELRVREELGEEVDPAEYAQQYPELTERLIRQLEFCRELEAAGSVLARSSSRLASDDTVPAPSPGGWPSAADAALRFTGTRRFSILRSLGSGGMGRVFAVYDSHWNQRVALKILHGSDSESLVRIRREFRMLADCSHPNLVQLFELHQTGRYCFFTMELLDGVDPLAWCTGSAGAEQRHRPVFDRVREFLWQLADVLTVLHETGKVHCDVKPSNLLVVDGGRVVLLDFGLAGEHLRDPASPRADEDCGGTLAYMAPERWQGAHASPAGDWYSVGVLLYLLLTGRHPFLGNPRELIHRKQYVDPQPPAEINRHVPEDLNRICLDLLARDPAQRPRGREVLERLGNLRQRRSAAALAEEQDLFVGREEELSRLQQAWRRARGGRITGMLLHGHSGIGKTTLARAFLRRVLREEDACVLMGRCYETESVAFKALDRLVDDLAAQLREMPAEQRAAVLPPGMATLGKMFPALTQLAGDGGAAWSQELASDPYELRKQAAAAFQELLLRLSRWRPVVLFIDDVQWGDADSAGLLTSLLELRVDAALLLLFNCRSENLLGSTLPEAIHEAAAGHLEEFELMPLAASDGHRLAQLCLQQSGAALPARAQEIAAEAGGSPFLILALARWTREGDAGGRPAAAEISIDALLADFVGQLDSDARAVLETLAVAGHPLGFRNACEAAGVRQGQQNLLMRLRAGRYLRIDQVGKTVSVEPYHDRIREGLLRQLPSERKRACHLQLARVLQADSAPHARHLAQHYLAAGERRLAGRYAELAARQADEALAFDDAVRFYRVALETHDGPAEERQNLQRRLAEALASASRGSEAGSVFFELSRQQNDVNTAVRLLQRATGHFLAAGCLDEGIATFRDLLKALGLRWPATSRQAMFRFLAGRLLLRLRGFRFRERDEAEVDERLLLKIDACYSAVTAVSMVDLMRGFAFAPLCMLLSLRSGELGRVSRAYAMEGFLCYMNDPRPSSRAEWLFQRAERLAGRADMPRATANVQFLRTTAAFYQGDWAQVVQLSEETEHFIRNRCVGLAWEIATLHIYRLHALFYLGQFRKQAESIRAAIDEANQLNDPYFSAEVRTGTSNTAWLLKDDPQRARAELAEARRLWPGHDDLCPTFVNFIAEVQLHLYENNGDAAWQYITRAWPQMVAAKQLRLALLRAEMFNLRGRAALAAAAERDDPGELLRSVEADALRLERVPYRWTPPLALLLRAGAARRRGEVTRAQELLRAAIAGCDANHLTLYAAAARYRLGQLIAGDAGTRLVNQAGDAFHRETVKNLPRMIALLAP